MEGAKIQANAGQHAAVSYQRAGELIGQLELELEVSQLMERAQQADYQRRDNNSEREARSRSAKNRSHPVVSPIPKRNTTSRTWRAGS